MHELRQRVEGGDAEGAVGGGGGRGEEGCELSHGAGREYGRAEGSLRGGEPPVRDDSGVSAEKNPQAPLAGACCWVGSVS